MNEPSPEQPDREQSPYKPKAPLAPLDSDAESISQSASELLPEPFGGAAMLDLPGIIEMVSNSAAATCTRRGKTEVRVGVLLELTNKQLFAVNDAMIGKDLATAAAFLADAAFNLLVLGAVLDQETSSGEEFGVYTSKLAGNIKELVVINRNED